MVYVKREGVLRRVEPVQEKKKRSSDGGNGGVSWEGVRGASKGYWFPGELSAPLGGGRRDSRRFFLRGRTPGREEFWRARRRDLSVSESSAGSRFSPTEGKFLCRPKARCPGRFTSEGRVFGSFRLERINVNETRRKETVISVRG